MQCVVLCFVCFIVSGARAKDYCDVITRWGGNACTLQGNLRVQSVPDHRQVTQEKCNQFYHKGDFKTQPVVSLSDAKPGEKYTMVMVDPDAPNHPDGQYFLHWIVANIPGGDLKVGNLKNGNIITPYRPPTPPDRTGTHRYMFLVYKHDDSDVKLTNKVSDSQRRLFDLDAWTGSQPTALCGPLSGVQFRTNFSGNEG